MVFQHVGHEPLGTLNPLLKEAGLKIRYVNFARNPDHIPSLDSYYGLIVLGGPMGVYESNAFPHLKAEMYAIEQAIKKNIPVLGICLGAQLIAAVLGSTVRKAKDWELGWTPLQITHDGAKDPLFEHYKPEETVFQIHQDTFDIPKSAIHLAQSALCPSQAFKYGEKVYGLQFHLEVDQPMIERWMKRPENKSIITNSNGKINIEQIKHDTHKCIVQSLQLSQETFTKFIDLFNLPERPTRLTSSHARK
ncbi:MAG: type 1 glutamine amidotransferase [Bdellovibrionaceae bacterium]|nr:type 1 glutamine amidotransferase [Pseudobdellovibrionaceae bacterium]